MKRLTTVILVLLLVVAVNATPTADRVFDDYGNIRWEHEKARLDNFAIMLSENPTFVGYIFVWAGRRACPGEAQARAVRARNYLVQYRKLPENQVVWHDNGYNEEPKTILQPWPRGQPMLEFDSYVKPTEVEFIKNCRRGFPIRKAPKRSTKAH